MRTYSKQIWASDMQFFLIWINQKFYFLRAFIWNFRKPGTNENYE